MTEDMFRTDIDFSVMKKTQEYLNTFARFQTTEAIHAVERCPPPSPVPPSLFRVQKLIVSVLRGDADLHKFEIAQLGSLCPEEAEEAKTLIPR